MTDPSPGKWLGIDLGTFNSSAAIKTKIGSFETIQSTTDLSSSEEGQYLGNIEGCKEFPSFLSFDDMGEVQNIGMEAKKKAQSSPENVIWGIKRLLGKTYTQLKDDNELSRFPYRIRPNRSNGQCLVVVGNVSYTPEQLCIEMLKLIKHEAEKQTNSQIDSAVVSVPAYFDPLRVTPIVQAARDAGFAHVKTIPEPVAAALAYNIDITVKPINTVVFDLGAGTLDVTAGYMYRATDQAESFQFQVLKNTGNSRLGGMDMDDRLYDLILSKSDVSNLNNREEAHLRRVSESTKIMLSEETVVEVEFECDGAEHRCTVSQFDFKGALEGRDLEVNLLEECRSQVMAAIDESGWQIRDVELLVLIGGPTKLTCIQDVLTIVFNSNPKVLRQIEEFYLGNEKVNRMTAVAKGAAMSVDRKVGDRVPSGHGIEDIEIEEESMTFNPNILIPRDSGYPYKSKSYLIPWINLGGLFEFKILQHVPKSEMEQFQYEYRFVGIQKFAVKNPNNCMVSIQMGYSENKELEVIISNALSSESVTYFGVNQSTSIGVNYPMTVKKPPGINKSGIKKFNPQKESLEKFVKWAEITAGYIKRKVENHPIPQMLISQIIDELEITFNRGDAETDFEMVYTKLNSLIWNSNSRGVIIQNEYIELTNHLNEFEGDLFRTSPS